MYSGPELAMVMNAGSAAPCMLYVTLLRAAVKHTRLARQHWTWMQQHSGFVGVEQTAHDFWPGWAQNRYVPLMRPGVVWSSLCHE